MSWNVLPPPEWIETEQQVVEMGQYLSTTVPTTGLGIDTETTGLSIVNDRVILLSLSDGYRRFAMFLDRWGRHPWVQQAFLENPAYFKVGTNIKFDLHMLANSGIYVQGQLRDTVVMDWLFDENRMSHGLKETAHEYLGIVMKPFKEIFPMKKATKSIPGDTPGDAIRRVMDLPHDSPEYQAAIHYSGLDAFASMGVHNVLAQRLAQQPIRQSGYTLWDYFLETETEFTRVLWNLERRGFCICTGHLKDQMGPMEHTMEGILGDIARWAGWPVNPNSPKQLQKLFFEQLQMQPIKMTKGGASGNKQPSTDDETLQTWIGVADPKAGWVSGKIQEYRKVAKAYGTYIEGMLRWVDKDLRIHTTLKQTGAVTGRLSSAEPNLQNIPRPDTDDFKIRSAFVADPGKILIVADYDQLEMKLMAHFSQDPRMVQAILEGKDLHCFTVSLMYGPNYDDVVKAKKTKKDQLTDEQKMLVGMRQSAKATGFGLIYGIGPKKLGMQLTEELGRLVDMNEAKQLIRKYFDSFPGVEQFIRGTHRYCKQTEYVQTLVGRFRRLPEINARGGGDDDPLADVNTKGIAAAAQRQAVNSIIQGTAADIAKRAMIVAEVDPELKSLGADMLLQIHDELIFEIDDSDMVRVERAAKRVEEIMEDPFADFKLAVPLTVGSGVGYSWNEAK